MASLSALISQNLPGLRRLFRDLTTRTDAPDGCVTEGEFLRLCHEIATVYTTRPVVVEIYRNILLLERKSGGASGGISLQGLIAALCKLAGEVFTGPQWGAFASTTDKVRLLFFLIDPSMTYFKHTRDVLRAPLPGAFTAAAGAAMPLASFSRSVASPLRPRATLPSTHLSPPTLLPDTWRSAWAMGSVVAAAASASAAESVGSAAFVTARAQHRALPPRVTSPGPASPSGTHARSQSAARMARHAAEMGGWAQEPQVGGGGIPTAVLSVDELEESLLTEEEKGAEEGYEGGVLGEPNVGRPRVVDDATSPVVRPRSPPGSQRAQWERRRNEQAQELSSPLLPHSPPGLSPFSSTGGSGVQGPSPSPPPFLAEQPTSDSLLRAHADNGSMPAVDSGTEAGDGRGIGRGSFAVDGIDSGSVLIADSFSAVSFNTAGAAASLRSSHAAEKRPVDLRHARIQLAASIAAAESIGESYHSLQPQGPTSPVIVAHAKRHGVRVPHRMSLPLQDAAWGGGATQHSDLTHSGEGMLGLSSATTLGGSKSSSRPLFRALSAVSLPPTNAADGDVADRGGLSVSLLSSGDAGLHHHLSSVPSVVSSSTLPPPQAVLLSLQPRRIPPGMTAAQASANASAFTAVSLREGGSRFAMPASADAILGSTHASDALSHAARVQSALSHDRMLMTNALVLASADSIEASELLALQPAPPEELSSASAIDSRALLERTSIALVSTQAPAGEGGEDASAEQHLLRTGAATSRVMLTLGNTSRVSAPQSLSVQQPQQQVAYSRNFAPHPVFASREGMWQVLDAPSHGLPPWAISAGTVDDARALDMSAVEGVIQELFSRYCKYGEHERAALEAPLSTQGSGESVASAAELSRAPRMNCNQFAKFVLDCGLVGRGGHGGGSFVRGDIAVVFNVCVARMAKVGEGATDVALWKRNSFTTRTVSRSMLRLSLDYSAFTHALALVSAKRYLAPATSSATEVVLRSQAIGSSALASEGVLDLTPPPGAGAATGFGAPPSIGDVPLRTGVSAPIVAARNRPVPAAEVTPGLALRLLLLRHALPVAVHSGLLDALTSVASNALPSNAVPSLIAPQARGPLLEAKAVVAAAAGMFLDQGEEHASSTTSAGAGAGSLHMPPPPLPMSVPSSQYASNLTSRASSPKAFGLRSASRGSLAPPPPPPAGRLALDDTWRHPPPAAPSSTAALDARIDAAHYAPNPVLSDALLVNNSTELPTPEMIAADDTHPVDARVSTGEPMRPPPPPHILRPPLTLPDNSVGTYNGIAVARREHAQMHHTQSVLDAAAFNSAGVLSSAGAAAAAEVVSAPSSAPIRGYSPSRTLVVDERSVTGSPLTTADFSKAAAAVVASGGGMALHTAVRSHVRRRPGRLSPHGVRTALAQSQLQQQRQQQALFSATESDEAWALAADALQREGVGGGDAASLGAADDVVFERGRPRTSRAISSQQHAALRPPRARSALPMELALERSGVAVLPRGNRGPSIRAPWSPSSSPVKAQAAQHAVDVEARRVLAARSRSRTRGSQSLLLLPTETQLRVFPAKVQSGGGQTLLNDFVRRRSTSTGSRSAFGMDGESVGTRDASWLQPSESFPSQFVAAAPLIPSQLPHGIGAAVLATLKSSQSLRATASRAAGEAAAAADGDEDGVYDGAPSYSELGGGGVGHGGVDEPLASSSRPEDIASVLAGATFSIAGHMTRVNARGGGHGARELPAPSLPIPTAEARVYVLPSAVAATTAAAAAAAAAAAVEVASVMATGNAPLAAPEDAAFVSEEEEGMVTASLPSIPSPPPRPPPSLGSPVLASPPPRQQQKQGLGGEEGVHVSPAPVFGAVTSPSDEAAASGGASRHIAWRSDSHQGTPPTRRFTVGGPGEEPMLVSSSSPLQQEDRALPSSTLTPDASSSRGTAGSALPVPPSTERAQREWQRRFQDPAHTTPRAQALGVGSLTGIGEEDAGESPTRDTPLRRDPDFAPLFESPATSALPPPGDRFVFVRSSELTTGGVGSGGGGGAAAAVAATPGAITALPRETLQRLVPPPPSLHPHAPFRIHVHAGGVDVEGISPGGGSDAPWGTTLVSAARGGATAFLPPHSASTAASAAALGSTVGNDTMRAPAASVRLHRSGSVTIMSAGASPESAPASPQNVPPSPPPQQPSFSTSSTAPPPRETIASIIASVAPLYAPLFQSTPAQGDLWAALPSPSPAPPRTLSTLPSAPSIPPPPPPARAVPPSPAMSSSQLRASTGKFGASNSGGRSATSLSPPPHFRPLSGRTATTAASAAATSSTAASIAARLSPGAASPLAGRHKSAAGGGDDTSTSSGSEGGGEVRRRRDDDVWSADGDVGEGGVSYVDALLEAAAKLRTSRTAQAQASNQQKPIPALPTVGDLLRAARSGSSSDLASLRFSRRGK